MIRAGRLIFSMLFTLAILAGWRGRASARALLVPAEYPTIQAAVDAAESGDEVRVAAGTYRESIVWVGKAIALIGAGPGATIVDPASEGRCLTVLGGPSPGRVEGLTCQHGRARAADGITDGGGMWVQGGRLTVANVVLQENLADRDGGGLWIEGADVTVLDSSFLANEAASGTSGGRGGGLGVTHGGHLTVVGSTFVDNFANPQGGGITLLEGSRATVLDCRFLGNFGRSGGGIWADGGSLEISRSVFQSNTSDFSGAALGAVNSDVTAADVTVEGNESVSRQMHVISVEGDLTMTRSTLTNNTGGGIAGGGNLTVFDCLFANNLATRGGGISARGNANITNSLFFSNTANGAGGLNSIPARGGAIFAAGDLHVTRSQFYGNTARGDVGTDAGGAIYMPCGTATVIGSSFRRNAPSDVEGPVTEICSEQ